MTSKELHREGCGWVALRWWSALQPRCPDGTRNLAGDAPALAALRRAATPIEAIEEDAAIALYDRLFPGRRSLDFERLARVGTLASVLANVREHGAHSYDGRWLTVARAMGPQNLFKPTLALMSSLRFRRLLAARNEDEILVGFRRIVTLARRKVNVVDLSESILDWTDDEVGDKRRVRWAFDYHGAGIAAPGAPVANSPLASMESTP
jgi:CRISPR type I-E-associated protein CasB/Cse2